MVDDIRDVVIVGGGISGLTTGWYLHHADLDVCLLDAQTEVGGVTRTQRRDGFLLEKGPFNVIVRDPAFITLLEGLCDEVKIIAADAAAKKRFVYQRGRLIAVPGNPIAMATTPLLSVSAKLRLVRGMIRLRGIGSRRLWTPTWGSGENVISSTTKGISKLAVAFPTWWATEILPFCLPRCTQIN